MTYETIAYLGYAINTVPPAAPGSSTLPDPAADIAARCQLMMRAITSAAGALAAADQVPTVLKVFSAPEGDFNSACYWADGDLGVASFIQSFQATLRAHGDGLGNVVLWGRNRLSNGAIKMPGAGSGWVRA